MITRKHGWKKDSLDHRDYRFVPRVKATNIAQDISTTKFEPAIWDQGQVGSCTGHGVGGITAFERNKQNLPPFDPSRLFIYNNERIAEGTLGSDSGAAIRDGIKAVVKYGVCSENLFAYTKSNLFKKPPAKAYSFAVTHKSLEYAAVDQSIQAIADAIASMNPVVFGCSVFGSFQSAKAAQTGMIPMPSKNEAVEGGHCMVIVGYDHTARRFKVRNSWGTSWGKKGYCFMPYEYLTNPKLASDFWVISKMEA